MKIILTGATGYVGEGVLLECLNHPVVEKILVVGRKPAGRNHPRLKELIVPDFFSLSQHKSELTGYDACFYCAGISSLGMKESTYSRITYDATMNFAGLLEKIKPAMVFNFVSGSGTDSTENSRIMWARIKGKTENALRRLAFEKVYCFRPGLMKPTRGQENISFGQKVIIGMLSPFLINKTCTLREVGLAMIHAATRGYPKPVLEVMDIRELAK